MPISPLLAVSPTVMDYSRSDAALLTSDVAGVLSSTSNADGGVAGSESVRISISAEALNAAAKHQKTQANKNADIEDSGLPKPMQDLLKRIRELREQLAQKQDELQKVMADPQMSEPEKEQWVTRLQAEIAALSGAIVSATQKLDELLDSKNVSDDQRKTAGFLLMK